MAPDPLPSGAPRAPLHRAMPPPLQAYPRRGSHTTPTLQAYPPRVALCATPQAPRRCYCRPPTPRTMPPRGLRAAAVEAGGGRGRRERGECIGERRMQQRERGECRGVGWGGRGVRVRVSLLTLTRLLRFCVGLDH